MPKLSLQTVKYLLIVVVTVGLMAGLLVCFWIAGSRTLTNNESVMLGVLMSFLSFLASWILTHVYGEFTARSATHEAKSAFDDKMSTFARKAAEKVFNLSNEFDRLAESLKLALDESEDEDTAKATRLILKEKMLSAIHILETLKSMNDTSLSDWQGIIGDDIQLQRKLQRQIEEELEEQREIIANLESRVKSDNPEAAEKRIRELEKNILGKVAALPFSFRPIRRRAPKQVISIECPSCEFPNEVRVRVEAGAHRHFQCGGCNHFIAATFDSDDGISVGMEKSTEIEIACEECQTQFPISMPERIGLVAGVTCPKCNNSWSVAKTKDGIKHVKKKAKETDKSREVFLTSVVKLIPPRPWPQGIHKEIATKLGVSNAVVSRAFKDLMHDGRIDSPPDGGEPKPEGGEVV